MNWTGKRDRHSCLFPILNMEENECKPGNQMPENLGSYDPSLRDVYFIEGIGLCSNVYIFTDDESISLVDTGSGMPPNTLTPQLEQLGLKTGKITKVFLTQDT